MELVQHHGPNALERRIGEQPSREHSFGNKSHPRSRADCLFKPNLVTGRLPNLFAHLPGHTSRRQSGSDPPRFQYNHFTTHNFKQSRRHAGRLTRARGCLNDKVRRSLERRDHLRQNRVHRKYNFAGHQFSSKHAPSPPSTPPPPLSSRLPRRAVGAQPRDLQFPFRSHKKYREQDGCTRMLVVPRAGNPDTWDENDGAKPHDCF
jgi:hypothetical protein